MESKCHKLFQVKIHKFSKKYICESESRSVMSDSLWPIVHGILQTRILEWVAFPFSRGSSQSRDQTEVSHSAGRFFTSGATAKPKNTGVVSLSLLQWIFLTQELNRGLLHCRQILYQLSYKGSPILCYTCYTYTYKSFFTMLDKGLRKNNNNKKRWRNWKTNWNRNTEYEIEKVKQRR